jgi:hypothetical protein
MNDPDWCRTRLDEMEDGLRRLNYSDDRMTGVLDETRQVWADVASREAFARFIDPYRSDTSKALKRLASQLARLREVVARMDEAEAPATEILRLSDESAQMRQEADIEIYTAHHRVDRALDEAAAAVDCAVQAEQVLATI